MPSNVVIRLVRWQSHMKTSWPRSMLWGMHSWSWELKTVSLWPGLILLVLVSHRNCQCPRHQVTWLPSTTASWRLSLSTPWRNWSKERLWSIVMESYTRLSGCQTVFTGKFDNLHSNLFQYQSIVFDVQLSNCCLLYINFLDDRFREDSNAERVVLDCITSLQSGADLLWIETAVPDLKQISSLVNAIRTQVKLKSKNPCSNIKLLNFEQLT